MKGDVERVRTRLGPIVSHLGLRNVGEDDHHPRRHAIDSPLDHTGYEDLVRDADLTAYYLKTEVNALLAARAVRASLTTDFSVANNAWTFVSLGTVQDDTHGFVSAGTFVVPAGLAGRYAIKAQGLFAAVAVAGSRRGVAIQVNGVNFAEAVSPGSTAAQSVGPGVTTTENLAVGDVVRLAAFQDTGGPINIRAGRSFTFLAMNRIGT